jgi:hypothetical protein
MIDLAHKKSSVLNLRYKELMIKVYLANRPPLAEYLRTEVIDQLPAGEIKRIADETGNHWRKIFNVYAKLMYSLAEVTDDPLLLNYNRWQVYRDQALLQQGSDTELHLGSSIMENSPLHLPLQLPWNTKDNDLTVIHIIMGKTYSERLLEDTFIEWLDKDFAINRQKNIIVCPYFDYRQLSNLKIQTLVNLILSLQNPRGIESTSRELV